VCGDPSHYANCCPERGKGKRCFICQDPNHFADRCPDRGKGKGKGKGRSRIFNHRSDRPSSFAKHDSANYAFHGYSSPAQQDSANHAFNGYPSPEMSFYTQAATATSVESEPNDFNNPIFNPSIASQVW
jgi:hypothetical protein